MYQRLMGYPMGNNLHELVKNNMFALIKEATEVLDEVNWRPWRADSKALDKEAIKSEIADCLFFIFNAAYEVGLDAEELGKIATKKQMKNLKRIDHVRTEE